MLPRGDRRQVPVERVRPGCPVTDVLERRLAELEEQLRSGARMVADQEAQLASTRATLLRIEGAAQVLRELLAAERAAAGSPAGPPP